MYCPACKTRAFCPLAEYKVKEEGDKRRVERRKRGESSGDGGRGRQEQRRRLRQQEPRKQGRRVAAAAVARSAATPPMDPRSRFQRLATDFDQLKHQILDKSGNTNGWFFLSVLLVDS